MQRPDILKLDKNHPLTSGLLAAFVPVNNPFINLVNRKSYSGLGYFETDGRFTQRWRTDGYPNLVEIDRLGLTSYTQQFTILAWIKPNSTSGTYDRFIGPIGATGDFGATIQVNPSDQIAAAANKMGVGDNTATSGSTITAGRWYHVAGTFSGSAVSLYIDGSFVTSTNYNATITSSSSGGTGWLFGAERLDGSYYNDATGSMAQVLFYRRVLSPTEIWQLWADPWAMYRPFQTRRALPFATASRRIFIVSA